MMSRVTEWRWVCPRCGSDSNTNQDHNCATCGATIRCDAAGGHSADGGVDWRENGCGYNMRTNKTDLAHRRLDY